MSVDPNFINSVAGAVAENPFLNTEIGDFLPGNNLYSSRITAPEIEEDLRSKFYDRIQINNEIISVGGCQIIESYICDSDCNKIVLASSSCPTNYKYNPIDPKEVVESIVSKIISALEEDRKMFIKKCLYYRNQKWKLEAYAIPSTLTFFIKFLKKRNDKDVIDEKIPLVANFKAAKITFPLLTQGEFVIDPFDSMVQQVKDLWPNKVFILKYHWDEKENVCKELGLSLNVDAGNSTFSSDEYLTSIDAYYSIRAPIYRYSSKMGSMPAIPNYDFNNTKDLDPFGIIKNANTNPLSYLESLIKVGNNLSNQPQIKKLLNSANDLNTPKKTTTPTVSSTVTPSTSATTTPTSATETNSTTTSSTSA